MLQMVIKLTMLYHYNAENRRKRNQRKKKFFKEAIVSALKTIYAQFP